MLALRNPFARKDVRRTAEVPAARGRNDPLKAEGAPVPAPGDGLAPHVDYPRTFGRRFEQIARDLDLLTPSEAEALRDRAALGGGYVEQVALDFGLTTEKVQEVLATQAFHIYVDARHYGTPRFLSWEAKLRRCGASPQVRKVSAQELAVVRQQRNGQGQLLDTDLKTLALAVKLLCDSAAMRASDVHVLVRDDHTEIQIRVEGELRTVESLSMRREEGERLIRAMYSGLATVKDATYNPLDFQNAQIAGEVLPNTGLTSVRIVRGPAYPVEAGGGFLVARLQYSETTRGSSGGGVMDSPLLELRIPDSPGGTFRLGEMGYSPTQLALIDRLLRQPQGVIVMTGPTGSGKTTTLYECTQQQARLFPSTRLITIEDPTEYPMSWAIQLPAKGDRFPEMVRMTLRMDPDSVLLGEIRGAEEAVAAFQAANTGHLVLTTLHVNDAFETFSRLEGLDPVRLAPRVICNHTQIIGLIAQRIVPVLCPHCSVPLAQSRQPLPAYMMEAMASWGDLSKVRVIGDGCEHCRGLGIAGRRAVAEVVVTSESLMQDYIEHGQVTARRNHRRRPGSDKPMIAHAMDLVLAGRVSPIDAQRNVAEIPMKEDLL